MVQARVLKDAAPLTREVIDLLAASQLNGLNTACPSALKDVRMGFLFCSFHLGFKAGALGHAFHVRRMTHFSDNPIALSAAVARSLLPIATQASTLTGLHVQSQIAGV